MKVEIDSIEIDINDAEHKASLFLYGAGRKFTLKSFDMGYMDVAPLTVVELTEVYGTPSETEGSR